MDVDKPLLLWMDVDKPILFKSQNYRFFFTVTYVISFFINRAGGLRKITFPEQFMIVSQV